MAGIAAFAHCDETWADPPKWLIDATWADPLKWCIVGVLPVCCASAGRTSNGIAGIAASGSCDATWSALPKLCIVGCPRAGKLEQTSFLAPKASLRIGEV